MCNWLSHIRERKQDVVALKQGAKKIIRTSELGGNMKKEKFS